MATAVFVALLLAIASADGLAVQASGDDWMEQRAVPMPPMNGASLRTRELENAASSGSGSAASPTPSPKSTPFKLTFTPSYTNVGTEAPVPEPTFFNLFPAKYIYLSVGIGGPILFFLYKLGMACWFCTAGRRKYAREDREREEKERQQHGEIDLSAAERPEPTGRQPAPNTAVTSV